MSKEQILFKNLDSQPLLVVEKILMNLDRRSIENYCDTNSKMNKQCVELPEEMWKWLMLRDCNLKWNSNKKYEWSYKEYSNCLKSDWLVKASEFGELKLVKTLLKDKKYTESIPEAMNISYRNNHDEVYKTLKKYLTSNGENFLLRKYYSRGAEKDYEKMEKYYKKASEDGNVKAMNGLAKHYQNRGQRKEMEKYYEMAIKNGDVDAMRELGYFYYPKNTHTFSFPNQGKATKYFEMAAKKGDDEAKKMLEKM